MAKTTANEFESEEISCGMWLLKDYGGGVQEELLHQLAMLWRWSMNLDTFISWNLRHLANFNKMAKINDVNLACGYTKRLELITPLEVV